MRRIPILLIPAVLAALVVLAAALSGCQILSQTLSKVVGSMGNPRQSHVAAATATATRTLTPSEAAKRAKENAEILQEVLRVVYDREPGDRATFGSLVDSMNQGASIEGLYNGFTHSSDYRKLEVENPGARPEALSFFASELARAESELKPPTEFGPEAARPLALPENPGTPGSPESEDPPGTSEIDYPGASPGPAAGAAPGAPGSSGAGTNPSALEASYLRTFSGASIFTLKRVLGDEMLKLVSQKSKDPKALQAWYGAWVARMCGLGVDFGIPLRNKADAAFHSRWASTADPDRLKWEVLNRIHRVLNARNAAPAPPRAAPRSAPAAPASAPTKG